MYNCDVCVCVLVCRCQHAREREKLQSLISELDQLAVEVDPATLLHKRKPRKRVRLLTNQIIPPLYRPLSVVMDTACMAAVLTVCTC